MGTITRILSRKEAINQVRIEQVADSLRAGDGEVILRLDLCAITTNNITYAALGESLHYWRFFPTGVEGWGHMPVWGFAEVVDSRVAGVATGERFYGYFPIANHLRVYPERVAERGFFDGAANRRGLPGTYNLYTRCSWDACYSSETEPLYALLKPLLGTACMLADYLDDNDLFGARQVVYSSASSKTAYAAASCLGRLRPALRQIALTSPRNLSFVQRLSFYDSSCTYAQLDALDNQLPTVYVDFSGDPALRERVHRHFGEQLLHSCFAGSAQTPEARELACPFGPEPKFFFAPVQIDKRRSDWGTVATNEYLDAALLGFYASVTTGLPPALRVVEQRGMELAARLIEDLYDGKIAADEGHVIRFWPS